ncbi:hypothetical protein GCM10027175_24040 [Hymenobacter latericoloratus]
MVAWLRIKQAGYTVAAGPAGEAGAGELYPAQGGDRAGNGALGVVAADRNPGRSGGGYGGGYGLERALLLREVAATLTGVVGNLVLGIVVTARGHIMANGGMVGHGRAAPSGGNELRELQGGKHSL